MSRLSSGDMASSAAGSTDSGAAPAANNSSLNPLEQFAASENIAYGNAQGDPPSDPPPAEDPPPSDPPADPPVDPVETELPVLPEDPPVDPPPGDPQAPADLLAYAKQQDPSLFGNFQSQDALLASYSEQRKKISEKSEYERLGEIAHGDPQKLMEYYRKTGVMPADAASQPQPAAADPNADPSQFNPDWVQYIDGERVPDDVKKQIVAWNQNRQIEDTPKMRAMEQRLAELTAQVASSAQPDQTQMTPDQIRANTQQQIAAQRSQDIDLQTAQSYVQKNMKQLFKNGDAGQGMTRTGDTFFKAVQDASNHGYSVEEQIAQGQAKVESEMLRYAPANRPNSQVAGHRTNPDRITPDNGEELILPGESMQSSMLRQMGIK